MNTPPALSRQPSKLSLMHAHGPPGHYVVDTLKDLRVTLSYFYHSLLNGPENASYKVILETVLPSSSTNTWVVFTFS